MIECLAFMHVIKTGGTTLVSKFKEEMEGRFRWGHDFVHNSWKDPDKLIRWFTIIRDPADWLVSIYHQATRRARQDIDFEHWYEIAAPNPCNPQKARYNRLSHYVSRFCGYNFSGIYKLLDDCWGVTITTKLDEDLPRLIKYFGLTSGYTNERVTGEYDRFDKCMTPKKYKLKVKMRKRIYQENPEDVKLFEYAKEKREQWIARLV